MIPFVSLQNAIRSSKKDDRNSRLSQITFTISKYVVSNFGIVSRRFSQNHFFAFALTFIIFHCVEICDSKPASLQDLFNQPSQRDPWHILHAHSVDSSACYQGRHYPRALVDTNSFGATNENWNTSRTSHPSMSSNDDSIHTMDWNPQNSTEELDRVCIIGSGNWGSAIATIVGRNCARLSSFESKVNMWVFEETVEDENGQPIKLTEYINTRHENVKYLKGIRLPNNIIAEPDLEKACRDATLLIFVLPHQFLPKLMPTIRNSAHPNCRGVSLIKGLGKITEVT